MNSRRAQRSNLWEPIRGLHTWLLVASTSGQDVCGWGLSLNLVQGGTMACIKMTIMIDRWESYRTEGFSRWVQQPRHAYECSGCVQQPTHTSVHQIAAFATKLWQIRGKFHDFATNNMTSPPKIMESWANPVIMQGEVGFVTGEVWFWRGEVVI